MSLWNRCWGEPTFKKSQKDNIYKVHLQSITSYVCVGSFNFVACNTLPIAANRRVSYVQMNSDLISRASLSEQRSCTVSCVIWSRHQLLRCRSLRVRALVIDDPSDCALRIVTSQLQYLRAGLQPTERCGAHAQIGERRTRTQLQPFCVFVCKEIQHLTRKSSTTQKMCWKNLWGVDLN